MTAAPSDKARNRIVGLETMDDYLFSTSPVRPSSPTAFSISPILQSDLETPNGIERLYHKNTPLIAADICAERAYPLTLA